MKRCKWLNLNNDKYVRYHDEEWGIPVHNDRILYEALILECFQSGLSWECILNKREAFREAYDQFDIDKVVLYDENKIQLLLNNREIVRNRLKIEASIKNSCVFKEIQNEYGSFDNYLRTFTKNQILFEIGKTSNELSDRISSDLKQRGMKFVGSVTIYSFLQAVGVINSHEKECEFFHHSQKR